MSQTYKVGIVGCGQISRGHVNAWHRLPQCRVSAVCDVRKEAAEALAHEAGVKAIYTDYRQMLADADLDFVSVCTWTQTHAEVTIAAAQAGVRAILCEKPAGRSLAEVDAMMAACDAANTKLAVRLSRRYEPAGMKAQELVAAGAIGTPYLVWTWSSGGLANWSVYMIDFLRAVLGDPAPQWVFGQTERKTDRYERRQPIEDRCVATVGFSGGARGLVESDAPPTFLPRGWLVHGTEGVLQFTTKSLLSLKTSATGGMSQEVDLSGVEPSNAFEETFKWAIGEISDHRTSMAKHRPTLEIMMGIYESARTRGLVEFPLESSESPLDRMIADGSLPVLVPGRYDIRLDEAGNRIK